MSHTILELCSFWDTVKENSYHCFYLGMFGMAVHDGTDVVVTSNSEAGIGRFDICIEFRKIKRVFIFEIKKSDKPETLLDDARTGLHQILRNKYSQRFEEHCECILMGVSFCVKTMSPLVCGRTRQRTWDQVRNNQIASQVEEVYPAQKSSTNKRL